jgi:hypothetical protein
MKKVIAFTEQEVCTMITSNLKELVQDEKYYYSSSVDSSYSTLTKEGEHYIIKIMAVYLPLLADAQEHELNERAKATVFNTLKDVRENINE